MNWYTSAEAGKILRRSPKTIRNLVAKHSLERKLIGLGRQRRRAMLLPQATIDELRRLCWDYSAEAVKKNRVAR